MQKTSEYSPAFRAAEARSFALRFAHAQDDILGQADAVTLLQSLQESEFATGLHVVVNFGDEPFTLADGRTVPGRGSLIDE